MQHVASMPSSLKLRQRQGKYILKKAMEPILPKEILYRRKQGFAIPLDHWFRKDLRDFARPALLESDDGILDPSYVRKIWGQHQKGTFDRSAYLWTVLMFRAWKNKFQA